MDVKLCIKINSALLSLDEGETGYCVLEDKIYKTNEVAKDIIQFLDEHKTVTVEKLLSFLIEIYDIEKEELFVEVEDFLNELKKLDLVNF